MHSLRKWFYKPKKEDSSKLALFYWADEELTVVATELDSFDGRTDPDRCSVLVSQLRVCQDKVLSICNEIMDDAIPDIRANRDFRAKFPDDVLHENLAGQLWFGAECLAAGSNIIHRELESASMRPLAKALTRALDNVRCLLREQSLKNALSYSDKVKEALRIFDRLFAEFELCYVSAMVPIKSAKEYHLQQEIVVLFSETLIRALKMDLVQQDMIDDYDPSLMFTIPRLAIVWGLLLFPEGPFNVDRDPADLSELFRPFCSLLFKIRDLLWTLTRIELCTLEKMLCSQEEPKIDNKAADKEVPIHSSEDYISKFYQNNRNCKQFIQDFYAYNFGIVVSENGSQEMVNEEKDMSDLKDMETNVMNCRNDEELDVKLESVYESQVRGKTPEHLESDIETLVSGDFGASECNVSLPCLTRHAHNEGERVHIYSHSDNFLRTDRANVEDKHFEDTLNDNLRTNFDTSECLQQNRVPLSGCQSLAKCENCSFCSNIEEGVPAHTQDALSLERSLSRLHAECTCNMDVTTSSERHAPSRELMRQVMRRVEIVPHGQQITGYSSSPEGSPRAYHHGLLSHSFPAHPGYEVAYGASGTPTATWCKRRHRLPRHPNLHNRSFRFDCDISPSRPYYNSHCTSPDGINSRSCRNSSSRLPSSPLLIPHVQRLRAQDELAPNSDATYSSCSSCQSISSVSSPEWDSTSPETSSYNSECQDDEEIALALQAAEIASRNKARSRFKSSNDLLHKLFVCISGVADQLQTNYASDLRNILKSVFDINCSQSQQNSIDDTTVSIAGSPSDESPNEEEPNNETVHIQENENSLENTGTPSEQEILLIDQINDPLAIADQREDDERDRSSVDSAEEAVPDSPPNSSLVISDVGRENENLRNERSVPADPPPWLPDELSSHCMACKVQFTILRRRHHCRNCGKIFCSRCSSNSIPLPRFGHLKPVRVCNQCFMYQLTSYVMQQQQS